MSYSLRTSLKSRLVYWLPRSLWKISQACLPGWRLNQAMHSIKTAAKNAEQPHKDLKRDISRLFQRGEDCRPDERADRNRR